MSEQHPGDRPGHLDIDAVSAFVDRDLVAGDLSTIEIHLHECPACHREVLEIRTTVTLLAALPQYTPRRSFCLGHEHARAARRERTFERQRGPASYGWSAAAPPVAAEHGSGATWVPGLQAAAMVIGAMLLLVTSSDLVGMPPQPAEWLAEPAVVRLEYLAPTAPAAEAPPPQAFAPAADGDVAPAPGVSAPEAAPESAIGIVTDQAQGTAGGDSASQEVLVAEDEAQTAPGIATSAAMAAVTQAVPTPGVVARAARGPETTSGGDVPGPAEVEVVGQPSKLRLVQIALALALAWLVVSIVGLRWVRGLR